MSSLGVLVWIACKPLFRLAACATCGIIATKADIFPLVATKSTSQIIINIIYPCLLFSKTVAAPLSGDNVRALGPLVVVALVYQAIGCLLGFGVKHLFWVPHRFRYGIILAGTFGNVGDVPTALALGVTSSAPFNGTSDQNLAVAYISVFLFVFVVSLFPMGLHKLIMWDFDGPGVEAAEVMEATRRKRRALFRRLRLCDPRTRQITSVAHEPIESKSAANADSCRKQVAFQCTEIVETSPAEHRSRKHSPSNSETPSKPGDRSTEACSLTAPGDELTIDLEVQNVILQSPGPSTSSRRYPFVMIRLLKKFVKDLLSPMSLSILISFPITLIPTLKALFVTVPGTSMPNTPDGQPPLSFVLDVTTFIGDAAVPLSLICLGSSLARLHVPKKGEWNKLPLGAIGWLAAGKLLIMPVIGVLMCQGLTKAGFISKDDKVLRLICMIYSCLPIATSQVFLTQMYSKTGSAEDISAFLVPQYLLMFVSMTATTAYALHIISS